MEINWEDVLDELIKMGEPSPYLNTYINLGCTKIKKWETHERQHLYNILIESDFDSDDGDIKGGCGIIRECSAVSYNEAARLIVKYSFHLFLEKSQYKKAPEQK